MIAALCVLGSLLLTDGEASARWSCEPASAAVGEPFTLVLELEHPRALSAPALVTGTLTLDDSWVILSAEPPATEPLDGDRARTRCSWQVASLEPGERTLGEALTSVALAESVTRIQVGDAHLTVRGVLAAEEDEPRPLREFPDGFAELGARAETARTWLWTALAGLAIATGLGLTIGVRRRRSRRSLVAPVTPLEVLGALERAASRESCFELTRLLREAGDRLRQKARGGLTDEEWLAEAHASLEIPRGVVSELGAVFERAARVKYAGDAPTEWALKETFGRARAVLESLGSGGARS